MGDGQGKLTKHNRLLMADEKNIKDLHIKVCLAHNVEAGVSAGFERIKLSGGFPDFSFSEMDTSCDFLGKTLSLPLMIAPLTGGGSLSRNINRRLAEAAETLGLGMAIGSQKLMLDNLVSSDSYFLRDIAPNIPFFANIGITHVKRGRDYLLKAVESIEADGLILYVNPIQEALQAEEEKDFRDILPKLEEIIADFPYPVILKEVGAGMPEPLIRWAAGKQGIRGIDVAGLGGTNWARIEGLLSERDNALYESLGMETIEAVITARKRLRVDQYLIASGGVRNGIDIAKALALGADLVSMGLPFLRWACQSSEEIIKGVTAIKQELQVAMWYTGSISVKELPGKYSLRLCPMDCAVAGDFGAQSSFGSK
jgi:isopentenyl-diphosphate delta-isomerase